MPPARPRNTSRGRASTTQDGTKILLFLLAFRTFNAFTLKTFFQPDEYFQSLEPAWKLAYGGDSGAWITWEWREYLRSSIHPFLFSYAYKVVAWISTALQLDLHSHGELLVAAPKLLQACLAALMDLYTWKLSNKHYGPGSEVSLAMLYISLLSPWQWFCSTRTLMNSLECTLTAAALYYWPWDMFTSVTSLRKRPETNRSLLYALTLAALASIFRAPNILIWLVIGGVCFVYRLWLWERSISVLSRAIAYAILVGCYILVWSAFLDWRFYGIAVFPPYRFIQFNVVQSLAVFYGQNRADYYFTEGLPILLTALLPFAIHGMYRALRSSRTTKSTVASHTARVRDLTLILVVLVTIGTLTTIPHKEVRFLYPLVPIFHLFAAPSFAGFFAPLPFPNKTGRKMVLLIVVVFNIALALYASLVHQRGVIDVITYLRHAHEILHPTSDGIPSAAAAEDNQGTTTVAFLMPCHSTPWRSHLVHSGIHAWALTCEPPLNQTLEQRAMYLDEADVFYARSTKWMEAAMAPLSTLPRLPRDRDEARKQVTSLGKQGLGISPSASAASTKSTLGKERRERKWPMFLVFFEQLEPVMRVYPGLGKDNGGYTECWRGFNSHFHDDWRRKGDVVVWCLQSVKMLLDEESLSSKGKTEL
ncbi:Alg9-like mannosyltransferase family-domain-containing protein [Elsinoe ampelina]|uniref:Mannosyltransferase n=1 Tax=Elsinoe ampelina TaxID=302913 RepID=A0A6A6GDD4_9PEZI|nr:Alg9-like mannosyltransferase family-domain-containing protein [Elsinoe ampelina]